MLAFWWSGCRITGNGLDDRFMIVFVNGLGRLAPKLDLRSSNMIMWVKIIVLSGTPWSKAGFEVSQHDMSEELQSLGQGEI